MNNQAMAKSANRNLMLALQAKNDEFYTLYKDVEAEVLHYREHLIGKVILCNCNDGMASNFHKFFVKNFNLLRLKHLHTVSYASEDTLFERSADHLFERPLSETV